MKINDVAAQMEPKKISIGELVQFQLMVFLGRMIYWASVTFVVVSVLKKMEIL